MNDLPLGHIDLAWYLLAETEIAGNAGRAANDFLRNHLNGKAVPIFEVNLQEARIAVAVKDSDPARFLASLDRWLDGLFFVQSLGQSFRQFSMLSPTYGEIKIATPDQIASPDGQHFLKNALLAFGVSASLRSRFNALRDLNAQISTLNYSDELKTLACIMAETSEDIDQADAAFAASINHVAIRGANLQPDEVFVAALHIIQLIERTTLKTVLIPIFARWLRERWDHAIVEQAFLLRSPSTNIPAIRQALQMQDDSIHYCAHLLATVAPAAKTRLAESFRDYLAKLSTPRNSNLDSKVA